MRWFVSPARIKTDLQSLRSANRFGSTAMIASRSASLNRPHCAISASVRPQPSQSLLMGSITQILMQGVEAALTVPPEIDRDLGELLGRAKDVARLPADEPPCHARQHGSRAMRQREPDQ